MDETCVPKQVSRQVHHKVVSSARGLIPKWISTALVARTDVQADRENMRNGVSDGRHSVQARTAKKQPDMRSCSHECPCLTRALAREAATDTHKRHYDTRDSCVR